MTQLDLFINPVCVCVSFIIEYKLVQILNHFILFAMRSYSCLKCSLFVLQSEHTHTVILLFAYLKSEAVTYSCYLFRSSADVPFMILTRTENGCFLAMLTEQWFYSYLQSMHE